MLFQKVHHSRKILTTPITTLKCVPNENSVANLSSIHSTKEKWPKSDNI